MDAQDKYRTPDIAGLNKYNEKERRHNNISGKNHHVATLGHDPVLGWVLGTMNIMSSSITFCDFNTYDVVQTNPTLNKWGQKINYAKQYSLGEMLEYCVNSGLEDNKRIPAAVVRQAMHFASDKYCTQGLPIPLLSTVNPEKAQELIEKGWNSREFAYLAQHDLGVIGLEAAISILINTILKAIYLHCIELDEEDTQIKEVRIRKVLTVANLIVSTSNVVYVGVTGKYEKLDIGGIGVSLIQLFTTKKFIDKVKQEFIASGIEQAIMGNDDWLQYVLKENPNMSKREELINQGRHQIADPMAKKMGQLKEGAQTVLSDTISAVDRQNIMLRQVVTEGKDKSLGIKRLVSFADLSEDHDIDIVHKILDKYCTCGITEMNQEIRDIRKGLNETKRFVDCHNSVNNSYEFLFGELEDQEIASRLLFEIITLCNCFLGGRYNREEYRDLVEEMIISQKERNNIEEYIEGCYLDYSINKWIEIFIAGYTLNEKRGTDEQQYVLEDQDRLQDGMDGNTIGERFDEMALANLQSIMEKYGINRSDDDYKSLTETFFAITPDAYLGKNFGTYFTVSGLYYAGSDVGNSNEWKYMSYREICIEKCTISQDEKNQYILLIPDINGNCIRYKSSMKICEYIKQVLSELICAKTAKNDEYSPIWLEESYLYGEILIDFLEMGGHNILAALKKCSEFIEDGEDDQDICFRQICEYGLATRKITSEALKDKVLEWKSSLEPHVARISLAILFKDLVEILQLATGEVCTMTFVEKSFLDWLANEAEIKEINRFTEVVVLPYGMITEKENMYSSYAQNIADIDKYARKRQLYIPYNILDNEKIGLWEALHKVSKKYWSFLFPSTISFK